MNILRKIRIALAIIFWVGITWLFLDFTGLAHTWLGWMAKVQLLPAILASNFVVVALLVVVTLLFGRVYCSIICPLGVMQDVFGFFGHRSKRHRYRFSPARNWLRYGVLVLFVATMIAGFGSLAGVIAPYSAYGRIASNLFAPVYRWGNNLLAYFAERADSYAFYSVDVWIKSISTFVVAALTFVVVGYLAWRHGRTWCSNICPVGTVLGLLSRFSLFRPVIDTDKCISCGKCGKLCKASCIDTKNHKIDLSRCVACFDCIDNCSVEAIKYSPRRTKKSATSTDPKPVDASRRNFLIGAGLLAASAVKAQERKVDGGLAVIEDKKIPERATRLVPAGAKSLSNMAAHCTACQLCISACPNGVLSPSTSLMTLMQPEMNYERGYCRPECTRCSEVCPTGAIDLITKQDKSSTQIGRAVWIRANCVVLTDNVACGNCARHCPSGAITMISIDVEGVGKRKVPSVNTQRCIGCGACENLCPARPFSAIYVEGNEQHRTI